MCASGRAEDGLGNRLHALAPRRARSSHRTGPRRAGPRQRRARTAATRAAAQPTVYNVITNRLQGIAVLVQQTRPGSDHVVHSVLSDKSGTLSA